MRLSHKFGCSIYLLMIVTNSATISNHPLLYVFASTNSVIMMQPPSMEHVSWRSSNASHAPQKSTPARPSR